jgi:hypothetical protein
MSFIEISEAVLKMVNYGSTSLVKQVIEVMGLE